MRRLLVVALAVSAVVPPAAAGAAPRPRFVIDADTANEVDDPYAIVRALLEPSIEVIGLSSAQWQASHWATPDTLEDSQRLNEVLLGHLVLLPNLLGISNQAMRPRQRHSFSRVNRLFGDTCFPCRQDILEHCQGIVDPTL
jgi:hypothetical protein